MSRSLPLLFVSASEPLAPTLRLVSALLARIDRRRGPRVAAVWVSALPVLSEGRHDPHGPPGAPVSIEVAGRWRLDWLEAPGRMGDSRDRLITWLASSVAQAGVLLPVVGRHEPWRDVRRALRRWRAHHGPIVGRGYVADDGAQLSVRPGRGMPLPATARDHGPHEAPTQGGHMSVAIAPPIDHPAPTLTWPPDSDQPFQVRADLVRDSMHETLDAAVRARRAGRLIAVLMARRPLHAVERSQIAGILAAAPAVTMIVTRPETGAEPAVSQPTAPSLPGRLLFEPDVARAVAGPVQWLRAGDQLVLLAWSPADLTRLRQLVLQAARWRGAWDEPDEGMLTRPLWPDYAGPVSEVRS